MNELPHQFDLGDVRVDLWTQRVTRAETLIPLPKLSFDLLIALARAAPKLMSVDELMTAVWPGLVVNPETVAQRVKMLRDSLGDDTRSPRYIESVRSRGYRLLLEPVPASAVEPASTPVESAPMPVESTGPPQAEQPPKKQSRLKHAALLAVLILIVLLAGVPAVQRNLGFTGQRRDAASNPVENSQVLPEKTVAVMPFGTIGGDARDALLASGISENIRVRLGSLPEITVIARTSLSGYNGKQIDAPTVGHELNARYLLEGSLQPQHDLIRVTARLVDAQEHKDLWSVYFDRKPGEILAVQDEISAKVARALKVTLDADEEQRLQSRGTNNLDAYLEYVQARNLMVAYKSADIDAAITHYRKAIQHDPEFAAAYSGLAFALYTSNAYGQLHLSEVQWDAIVSQINSLVSKAQQLDPRNAESYLLQFELADDAVKSRAYLQRAIALEPNSARAHYRISQSWDSFDAGSPADYVLEKMAHQRKAMDIDPLNPLYPVTLANEYLFHRTNEVAAVEPLLMRSLQIDPSYLQAQEALANLRIGYQRRGAEGIRILERILTQEPKSTYYRDMLAFEYVKEGDIPAAEDVVADALYRSSRIITLSAQHRWREAVEVYAKQEDLLPGLYVLVHYTFALRMDAHQRGQYAAARKYFEENSPIEWDKQGAPLIPIPMNSHLATVIGLADILQKTGEAERARKILEACLPALESASVKYGRGDGLLRIPRLQVLALLGRDTEAFEVLAQMAPGATLENWRELEVDPIFDRMRQDGRFTNFLDQAREYGKSQIALVQKMRDDGEIIKRPAQKGS